MRYSDDDIGLVGAIIVIAITCVLIAVTIFWPSKDHVMDVKSIHWYTTIDIYQYSPLEEKGRTHGYAYTKSHAKEKAEDDIPDNAYDIEYEFHKDDDGHHTVYYTYTINTWQKTGEVPLMGNDKNPVEAKCDLPTDILDPKIGDQKRQNGYSVRYSVTGTSNGEQVTFDIPKDIWERLTTNDELNYKTKGSGDPFEICIAE